MSVVPPGWYADPATPGWQRWWSGQEWTAHQQQLPSSPPPPPAAFASREAELELGLLVPKLSTMGTRAMVWGIIAVLIPYVLLPSALAIIYGVVALSNAKTLAASGRPTPNPGRAKAGVILGVIAVAVSVLGGVLLFTFARR